MSVNSKMTAIADEIRELSGTAEAMGLDAMASNVGEVNAEVNSQTELLTQAVLALNGKTSGGGSGGVSVQSDWNQTDETAADFIKNKPFGDVGGDTLDWDIPADKITEDDLIGGMFIKISDAPVTMADIVNGFTVTALGETIDISINDCVVMTDGIIAVLNAYFIFVDENGAGAEIEGITFRESGVYLSIHSNVFTGAMTIDGFGKFTAIKKIDDKYVPDTFAKKQIFYIGLDENGVNRIYKGIDQTEVVSGTEFASLQAEPKQIVLVDGFIAWYIAVSITQFGAAYAMVNITGTIELKMAYHGDYTP